MDTLRRTGTDATHSLPSHGPRAGGGEQNTRRLNSPTNSLDSGWRRHSVTRPSAPTNGAPVKDVEEEHMNGPEARPPAPEAEAGTAGAATIGFRLIRERYARRSTPSNTS